MAFWRKSKRASFSQIANLWGHILKNMVEFARELCSTKIRIFKVLQFYLKNIDISSNCAKFHVFLCVFPNEKWLCLKMTDFGSKNNEPRKKKHGSPQLVVSRVMWAKKRKSFESFHAPDKFIFHCWFGGSEIH
jgi:hypothetical protein